MQFRTLGRTGWQVGEIGFGGWQVGGDWARVDDDASIRTLRHAFDSGVNFVDTAELYGRGHSEEVVGRAVEQWSGTRVYVATKIRPVGWPSPDDDEPQMRGRYAAWYLRDRVDAALRRLRTERIDLLQLHSWMPSGLGELDWLETVNELRVAGKVDHLGVSLRDYRPDEGVDLARLGLVDSQQVAFNLFEQCPADRLVPRRPSDGHRLHRPRPVRLRQPHRAPDNPDLRHVGVGVGSAHAVPRRPGSPRPCSGSTR